MVAEYKLSYTSIGYQCVQQSGCRQGWEAKIGKPFLILGVSDSAGAELDKGSNFGYGEDEQKAI